MPKVASDHQKLDETRRDSSLEVLRECGFGAWVYQHLDFGLLASKTVRKEISVIFKTRSLWHFVMTALGNIDFQYQE